MLVTRCLIENMVSYKPRIIGLVFADHIHDNHVKKTFSMHYSTNSKRFEAINVE